MNPAFLGDSYDLVKRFFIVELRALGYDVVVEPFFTGNWPDQGRGFFKLIQSRRRDANVLTGKSALFLDPDTGVRSQRGPRHVSLDQIESECAVFHLVFAFDQSFARGAAPMPAMQAKLNGLVDRGVDALYYDSHARFLFASQRRLVISDLVTHLHGLGVPERRLIRGGT